MEKLKKSKNAIAKAMTPEAWADMFFNTIDPVALVEFGTGNIVAVNEPFIDLFGYSENELLSMVYADLISDEAIPYISRITHDALKKRPAAGPFEKRMQRKDGANVWVETFLYKMAADLMLLIEVDISSRKVLEAEFSRAIGSFRPQLPKIIHGHERSIALMVSKGFVSKEIGDTLGLDPKTVDNYRSNIRQKLGVDRGLSLREVLSEFSF